MRTKTVGWEGACDERRLGGGCRRVPRVDPGGRAGRARQLRDTIRAAAPEATEVISYQVPTFKYRGRPLVSFGAAKEHCSFYVMSPDVVEAHKADLEGYVLGKGSIQFSAAKPLPAALVKKLVKARIAESEAGGSR